MSTLDTKLTAKQEMAVVALLSCRTAKEAAESIKVGESTLMRWLTTPIFRERYETERRQMLDAAKNALRSAALGVVETLMAVHQGDAPAGAKVTAAKTILDLCMKIQENDDILLRVERLEGATEDRDAH